MTKTWPNNLRVGCKSPFSLVEFIETYENLEKKLKQFEGDFEKYEVFEFPMFKMPIVGTFSML
jgi:hypothetical protein